MAHEWEITKSGTRLARRKCDGRVIATVGLERGTWHWIIADGPEGWEHTADEAMEKVDSVLSKIRS